MDRSTTTSNFPTSMALVGLLILLAFLLVALAQVYRMKRHRPLPTSRRWLQWLPKYWFMIPIRSGQGEDVEEGESIDHDIVVLELRDWLGPLGFELRDTNEQRLLFGRGSRIGDLTAVEPRRIAVTVPLPITNPTRVEVQYEASAVFDTGDLVAFAQSLLDKEEASETVNETAEQRESGNPYQSPR